MTRRVYEVGVIFKGISEILHEIFLILEIYPRTLFEYEIGEDVFYLFK